VVTTETPLWDRGRSEFIAHPTFHVHSHESAGFSLSASTTTEQLLGKPEQPASTSRVGAVYAESLSNGPYTHRVHNVGTELYNWVLAPGTVALKSKFQPQFSYYFISISTI
jgi:hypothetical protein